MDLGNIFRYQAAVREGGKKEKKRKRRGKKAGNSPASERTRGTNHSACFRVKPVAISKPDTTLVHLALPPPVGLARILFRRERYRHARRGGGRRRGGGTAVDGPFYP